MRYLDTSAALKLLVEEPESAALVEYLGQKGTTLVSSLLLFTELHCAAVRRGMFEPAVVDDLLSRVNLIAVEGADFVSAGRVRTGLRSADAIHLAVALRVQAEEMITYDLELAEAARIAGVTPRSPL